MYTPNKKTRLLMNTYFMSQFGYYALVWMTYSRTLNSHIKELHKIEPIAEIEVGRKLTKIDLC